MSIPTPIPKRIIILCDGTWQSAVSGKKGQPSNITRLARSLERVGVDSAGKTWQQIVWYDSGVGTTSSMVGKFVEGAVGNGLDGNVIEAYNFAVLNWCPGDQIFCFGFSRGAFTARTIAGLISDIGICEPRYMHEFPEIWQLYQKMNGQRFYGSDEFFEWCDGKLAEKQPDFVPGGYKAGRNLSWERAPKGDWAVSPESREIEVVGVFDTVGAIGVPSIHGWEPKLPFTSTSPEWHNVRLNRNIKHAFHALALDEHRQAFSPTMYHLPESVHCEGADKRKEIEEEILEFQGKEPEAMAEWEQARLDPKISKTEEDIRHKRYNSIRRKITEHQELLKPQSELLQVWFPGMHINVGGGSDDTLAFAGDMEEMANITFSWMLDHIKPFLAINHGTINQDNTMREREIADHNEAVRKFKENSDTWSNYLLRAAKSAVPFSKKGPNMERRDLGWGTGMIIDSYGLKYYANGSLPRTPGQYANATDKHGKVTTLGDTNEFIHPCVGYRIAATRNAKDEKKRYKPVDMDEKKFFRQRGTSGWEYSINGKMLKEYVMKSAKELGGESFERSAVVGKEAVEYVEELYGKPLWEY